MNILRAVGRFLLFVIGALFVQGLLQFAIIKVLHYQPAQGWTASDLLLSEAVGFFALFAATLLAARLERRNTAAYGFPLRAAFGRRWWEGMAWGALAPLVTFAMIAAAGAARVDGFALHGLALAKAAVIWLIVMILLGLFEELLFRGYPLETLARGIGFWPAAFAISVLFGALHYFTKPMENWVDATTVALIGLFCCFTVRRTGDLWFAVGFHTGFDYLALNVLGAPNTGNEGKPIPDHFLDTHFPGPDWITGGPRGLEASALMFVVIAALFFLFGRRTYHLKHADPTGPSSSRGHGLRDEFDADAGGNHGAGPDSQGPASISARVP